MDSKLTHVDEQGRVHMVDVGEKPPVRREAVAEAFFCAAAETLDRVASSRLPKGEAFATARVAGIMAAKRCDELIPLCHQLPLDAANVTFERPAPDRIRIEARVSTTARTGVEMEALTAVTVAALTLWDMTKAVDKDLGIEGVRLVGKRKGGDQATKRPSDQG
jgi:cyclic pyranopterin phosphate synthase